MTLYARIITLAAVLVALAVGAQAQTPEIDALRAQAEQGDAEAQYRLGFMYAEGRGVPQDDAEAVRWYRLAADQGDARAMSNLGGMYAGGRGVVQDYVQAHMWRNVAASRQTGEERKISADARDALACLMSKLEGENYGRIISSGFLFCTCRSSCTCKNGKINKNLERKRNPGSGLQGRVIHCCEQLSHRGIV